MYGVSGQLLAGPQLIKALISNQQVLLRFQEDRLKGRNVTSHNHTTHKLRSLCVKYYGKVTMKGGLQRMHGGLG
jgi:hypothetical protein